MPNIEIEETAFTGATVTSKHFNGNAIGTRNTINGAPEDSYVEAIKELNMGTLRYPAGQPDVAYLDGMVIDGGLPQHLINFLDSARANELQVVIVTPTVEAYSGPDELAQFSRLVMEKFGDVVHAFEIGNEYWNHQDEYAYGQIANESVLAIDEVLDELGLDTDIWVQMGDAGGRASAFKANGDGWIPRNIDANEAILGQLSPEAISEIDGVVEHYYFRSQDKYLDDLTGEDQLISLDYDIWQDRLGWDVPLMLTEWNIRTTNYEQLGMRAGSTMVAQFEFLLSLDVEEMYVWPPQHNTSSDLAGPDGVLYDDATGIVVNTVGGAIFDLMSSNLVGMENVSVDVSGGVQPINQHVYANDQQVIVYVASRSNGTEEVSFSLGNNWLGATLDSAIQVGYDQLSSDGRYYNYTDREWADAESVIIDGETYYLNEHDVNAQITEHDVETLMFGDRVNFELDPFEVIQLTFDLPQDTLQKGNVAQDTLQKGTAPQYTLREGTAAQDRIYGNNADERILGLHGDDVLNAGEGNDTVEGNSGHDFINLGRGHDVGDGGSGNDILRGWGGSDTLNGGTGNDLVDGSYGTDLLSGDRGDDTITGGHGDDRLLGGDGHDQVSSGNGNDTAFGGQGNDTLDGGIGSDQIFGDEGHDDLFGGLHFDELRGGVGNDTLDGDYGRDTLFGGAGNDLLKDNGQNGFLGDDLFFGGAGSDTVVGGGGNDTMRGQNGNDLLSGGLDDDLMFGGNHHDKLYGQAGNDTIHGGNGRDAIFGGAGNDVLRDNGQGGFLGADLFFGGAGRDTVFGGGGNDAMRGVNGEDLLFGGLGDDQMFGGNHYDTIHGEDGNDIIHGGNGRDAIFGGTGNDLLIDNHQRGVHGGDEFIGGEGNDTIRIGGGDDVATGGTGADTFNFFGDKIGRDVITDYQIGIDALEFDDAIWGGGLTEAQVVDQFADVRGGNVVFDFGNGNRTILEEVGTTVGLETGIEIF